MTTQAAPRRRTRRTAAPVSPRPNTLDGQLDRLYALKVTADEAKAAFDAGKKEFQDALEQENKTSHTLPAAGDRPAVKGSLATRTTTVIDPKKFKDRVDEDEFMACVSITQKEAKKYVGENVLDKVSTKSTGAAFLEVRALGGSRS
jgi:hypothetical protein